MDVNIAQSTIIAGNGAGRVTMRPTPQLLTPPKEEDEIYPYRRVWPSLLAEGVLLFGVALVLLVLVDFVGLEIPRQIHMPVNVALALLPLLLWGVFSYLGERSAQRPRLRLLPVVVVTALTANAVGVPLLNDYLQIDQWLSLESAANRIVGYTLTLGIGQELLKYLVVRAITWPTLLRIHLDAVAYGTTAAVGYASVLHLHFITTGFPPPDVVASRVFFVTALHLSTSAVVAYGMAASRFNTGTPILLPFTLLLAAVLTGAAIPLRSGLVNAGLVQGVGSPNALLGLLFSMALFVGVQVIVSFLFAAQERRVREAGDSREA